MNQPYAAPGYTQPGYGMYQPQYYPAPSQYTPYNSMANNEQRIQQILQTNPQLATQYQQPQAQQTPMVKGRPVSSVDEARAALIDFDGSVHVFLDLANGRIYTKRIGDNGAAVFDTYALQPHELPRTASAPVDPAELSALTTRVNTLEAKFEQIGGMTDESKCDATNRNASKQRQSNGHVTANGGE